MGKKDITQVEEGGRGGREGGREEGGEKVEGEKDEIKTHFVTYKCNLINFY